ncbi:hypothetical protein EDM52_24060 [Brevibacillus invocatus]|uniref:Uncharacterized protein n=1 Tax=Brevibacillus invocatus TaxID=173959 RepID=A0A3M8BMR2_9BACL|nr:hypothetical protein [Brevibacillus invocatus]RNB64593.1 hypothetical protein EDM52_24060 [Brevibacillus invocatus]
MYFADEDHEHNYLSLMKKYNLRANQDVQYEAAIYISAHPAIYKAFNNHALKNNYGPLSWYLLESDEAERRGHNRGALTGSTHRLVEAGLSLFGGYQVNLDDIIGSIASDDLFQTLIQAIKIRARKL